MINPTRTGRDLDVNALINAKNKVTLGFKCEAQLKMDLAVEAEKYAMSLSEYVEVLVSRRHQNSSDTENNIEIENLKYRLKLYENEKLKKLFENNKGKSMPYRDQNAIPREIVIEDIVDIYLYILESIKLH